MITKVRINFNFPAIRADRGSVEDVHGLVCEALSTIGQRLARGETAGDIRHPFYDAEMDAWDSYEAATFDVVDDNGNAVTDLSEVV